LTRDNIPSPSGAKVWSHQSLHGGGGKCGLLKNRKYIGENVYGTHHTIRNPEGGFVTRAYPESEHLRVDVPHLRIIDQDLWDKAQAVREGRSFKQYPDGRKKARAVISRSPDHLLAGILRCGVCNGHMSFSGASRGKRYVSCAAARNNSSCTHKKSYDVDLLKQIVVDNFRKNLIDPRRHTMAMRAAHAEYAALTKKNSRDRLEAEKQVTRLTWQIERLVDAIENSDTPVQELVAKMEAKEKERVRLVERVRLLGAANVVTLHPQVIDTYVETIETMAAALKQDDISPEVVGAFKNLMDSIVVQPTGYRQPYVVDAYGRLSAIMGVDLFPKTRSTGEILAQEGTKSAALTSNDVGQVQRGNTRRELRVKPSAVLSMAADAL
jgi:site-specific DNA recombinase